MMEDQIVTIAPRATAFTVVCDRCAAGDLEDAGIEAGWAGVTFAGSLDLDLDRVGRRRVHCASCRGISADNVSAIR